MLKSDRYKYSKKFSTLTFMLKLKWLLNSIYRCFDLHKVIVPLKEFVQPKLWRFSWKNQWNMRSWNHEINKIVISFAFNSKSSSVVEILNTLRRFRFCKGKGPPSVISLKEFHHIVSIEFQINRNLGWR